jgi:perosamine synthetase
MIKKMETKGIACRRPIFKPLHHYLIKIGFPGTDEIYKRAISIPIYPSLSKEETEFICKKIIEVIN